MIGYFESLFSGRSPKWRSVRLEFLKKNPRCASCGGDENLAVHHIKPFHKWPELELEESNLITLCEGMICNCHYVTGHLRDWRSWNTQVVDDSAIMLSKILHRPY